MLVLSLSDKEESKKKQKQNEVKEQAQHHIRILLDQILYAIQKWGGNLSLFTEIL